MTMNRFAAALLAVVVALPAAAAEPTKPTTTASSSASASTSKGMAVLLSAEAALRAGLLPKCLELAKDALKAGDLDEAGVAQAWLLRGRCHAQDGDADRAQRSYAVATRVSPTVKPPGADTLWTRVQPEGTAKETELVLLASAVVVAEHELGIEITTQDDLLLGAVVVLENNGAEIARAPVEQTSTTKPGEVPPVRAVRHRFSGVAVEGTQAKLLDRNGNVLRRAAVTLDERAKLALVPTATAPTPPTTTTTEVPAGAAVALTSTVAREPGVLAYVGAGTAVVGLAAAAICGIQATTLSQADPDNLDDDEVPFMAGAVAGAVVMAVGAGLIVVERL